MRALVDPEPLKTALPAPPTAVSRGLREEALPVPDNPLALGRLSGSAWHVALFSDTLPSEPLGPALLPRFRRDGCSGASFAAATSGDEPLRRSATAPARAVDSADRLRPPNAKARPGIG